jgi:hypothetical protein
MDQAHDMLAYMAATYDKGRPGLASWRNVQDTTNDPIMSSARRCRTATTRAARTTTPAGQMIWLDVDASCVS